MNTDEIKNTYGQCKKDKCDCLKDGWLGTLCPNWVPVEWNSFEEAIETLKKRKKNG